jgi:hypothetical protein
MEVENQNFEDANHDVFNDDEETQTGETETVGAKVEEGTEEVESKETEDNKSEETKEEKSEETSENEKGEKEEVEAPPADTDQNAETEHSEKMIPEHRFKAAIKDVTDKLNAATAENVRLSAQPAPDRNVDPDGYDLHVRMETSKSIMADAYDDYDEVIAHYQEMEKANPIISQVVTAHPAPAKHAYDLAKKDMEIRELSSLKDSDDWKEFQEFKKMKANKADGAAEAAAKATKEAIANDTKQKQDEAKVIPKVPNLNRATDVSTKQVVQDEDDELFDGAL